MQKKYLVMVGVLGLLHLVPSCDWFMRCDDPMEIRVKTDRMEVTPFPGNGGDNDTSPYDRKTLNFFIKLWPNDSLYYYWTHNEARMRPTLISSAVAREECDDRYVVLEEHISGIEILNLFDQNGFVEGEDITRDFVTGVWGSGLYLELEETLGQNPKDLTLVYKKVPKGDSVGFVINTTLSDSRIFTDTLILQLQ